MKYKIIELEQIGINVWQRVFEYDDVYDSEEEAEKVVELYERDDKLEPRESHRRYEIIKI